MFETTTSVGHVLRGEADPTGHSSWPAETRAIGSAYSSGPIALSLWREGSRLASPAGFAYGSK